MSTPASVVTSEIQAIEKRIGAFLDPTHIILIVLLAAALFTGIYLFESRAVKVSEAKQQAAEQALVESKANAVAALDANKQLQAVKDAAIAQLNTANASLSSANATLASAMKAEAAALANQQSVDRTMTPTQQSARWQQLVPGAQVVPTTAGFQVDAVGGLNTVLQLEQVPVLTSALAKAKTSLDNDDAIIVNDGQILNAEKAKHASDLITDAAVLDESHKETKKVSADFDTYKKKARRNILRAYAVGVGSGIVLRKFLGF